MHVMHARWCTSLQPRPAGTLIHSVWNGCLVCSRAQGGSLRFNVSVNTWWWVILGVGWVVYKKPKLMATAYCGSL